MTSKRSKAGGPGNAKPGTGKRASLTPFIPTTYDPDSPEGLKLHLSWRIIATGRMWRALLDERLRFARQTQPRWRVLAWASMLPGINQRDLADRMGISGPALVGILDSLADMGLIERRECAEDRRVNEIHLTDSAQPLITEILRGVAETRDHLLQDLSADEIRTMLTMLQRIEARMASAPWQGAA